MLIERCLQSNVSLYELVSQVKEEEELTEPPRPPAPDRPPAGPGAWQACCVTRGKPEPVTPVDLLKLYADD